MDRAAVLAAFNEQIRQNPDPLGGRVERDGGVVRVVSPEWSGVVWSELAADTADAAIAAQVTRFAAVGSEWEWKHYSYDAPPDLPGRLLAAGLAPEPAETLLVAEIADLPLDPAPPPDIELVPVADEQAAAALVGVHDRVFGGDHAAVGRALLDGVRREPSTAAGVLATADGQPVSAGRMEFHVGTDFASIWGGGTLPEWRGRGVFRALVAYRAALAAERGFRYLQVDALPASRPILKRLGFVALATTTPYLHRAAPTAR